MVQASSFVLLLALVFGAAAWLEVERACAPGCELRGNCNRELGICECPIGWSGDACDEAILGACRSSDSPTASIGFGTYWPKSCECWRQICSQFWDEELSSHTMDLVVPLGHQIPYCYERDGLPPEEQFSDVPEEGATGVSFFQLHGDMFTKYSFNEIDSPERITIGGSIMLLPLSKCADRCLDRGACYVEGGEDAWVKPEVNARCECRKGFTGRSCADVDGSPHYTLHTSGDKSCLNNCSQHGDCLAGFCKCKDGFWGMDCSRSKAYAADPLQSHEVAGTAYNRTTLKIYRYELPWHVTFQREMNDDLPLPDSNYAAPLHFFNLFTSDWVVRTENPYEANLFYVPILGIFMSGQMFVGRHVHHVMAYIRGTYPDLWGRHQGRDHFLFLPYDHGGCSVELKGLLYEAPMKLTSFGMTDDRGGYHKHSETTLFFHGCYRPERDIIIADSCYQPQFYLDTNNRERMVQATMEASPSRPNLMYFGGGIRPQQPRYSGGARQAFKKHVLDRNHSRVRWGGQHDQYLNATFCFNPYGDGFGNRLPHILWGSCVPVTVQERVVMPFNDIIPYQSLGLVLRVDEMPMLLDILEAIPDSAILEYRRVALKYFKAFSWHGDGEAYVYTLRSLHNRLYNLWSMYYRMR